MQEIEYEFREQDLVHFNELQFNNSKEIQKSIRNSRFIMPGILVIIGLFYISYYGDTMTGIYITVLAVAWSFTSPIVMRWSMRQQVLTSYTDKEKLKMFGQYKLTIEPQFLQEKSPGGKHRLQWKDLLRVEYGKRYVFIYIDISTALIIPVETVSNGNLEEFSMEAERLIDKFS